MTGAIELRCGDWREALADVGEVDALITDPPYSARTHTGMVGVRSGVEYASWTPDDVAAFVTAWSPRVRGWFVAVTDHVLGPAWERAFNASGRYAFQPLPFLEMGKQPRMAGDGPASWTCWVMVARPSRKPYSVWGSLPGGYAPPPSEIGNHSDRTIKGGKTLWLMRALVRDYTRPGDLVVDPCAGGATTLLAAAIEGRRAIGAELDPKTHALALKRIARGYTPTLFDTTLPTLQPMAAAVQSGLAFGEGTAANGGKKGK